MERCLASGGPATHGASLTWQSLADGVCLHEMCVMSKQCSRTRCERCQLAKENSLTDCKDSNDCPAKATVFSACQRNPKYQALLHTARPRSVSWHYRYHKRQKLKVQVTKRGQAQEGDCRLLCMIHIIRRC